MVIDTIVIHAMHTPKAPQECDPQTCIQSLERHRVSAHYLIDRDGIVWQTVSEEKRAWHAGESRMPFPTDSRENVNHFSIGIELLGREDESFTEAQYQALAELCAHIIARHPISAIIGHQHIAPLRKTDPGPHFNWGQLRALLQVRSPSFDTGKVGLP